jgi:hypothetical protein
MSRCSRGSAFPWIAAALFALGSLVLPPSSPAQAKVDFDETADKFTITVPIDLIGGEDDIAAKWNEAIRDYWNNGPGLGRFKYCGKSVEFVPDIRPIAAGEQGRPDAAKIRMQLVPPGRDIISNVRGIDPARNSTGTWGSNEGDATIAHEFGHILGLRDEYVWVPYTDTNSNGRWDANEPLNDDPNHNGKRDPEEPTHPAPGNVGSIMAEAEGKALQRHIDAVMDRPGIKCWKGTMKSLSVDDHLEAQACISKERVLTHLELIVAPDGTVTGQATAQSQTGNSNLVCGNVPEQYLVAQVVEYPATEAVLDVSGRMTVDEFQIELTYASGTVGIGFEIGLLGVTQSVPITAPGVAQGEFSSRFPGGGWYSENTFDLLCESCEEAVG